MMKSRESNLPRMGEVEIPFDAAGFIQLFILNQQNPELEPVWVAGDDAAARLPHPLDLAHLGIPLQTRILRLCSHVSARHPLSGHWCGRAFCAASAMGAQKLAMSLLSAWCFERYSSQLQARARLVNRMYRRRLNNGLVCEREFPNGYLDLSDVSGGLIPSIIRQRQWLLGAGEVVVISGGDRIVPTRWLWRFGENGIGEVVERQGWNALDAVETICVKPLNPPRFERHNGHLHCAGKQV